LRIALIEDMGEISSHEIVIVCALHSLAPRLVNLIPCIVCAGMVGIQVRCGFMAALLIW
jgi:hypothetical protein